MQLSREDIIAAAENIDLYEDDYTIREAYSGRGMYGGTCFAIDLPDTGKLTEFLVSLALGLSEDGRGEDALDLARKTHTDSMGFGVVAYWPGVELDG
ncbi:hypothetical protein ACH4F6_37895 [Streptomyces sp. NPDC017936]|uniref:hypothetical protein n=1 Tax=Streptomyces sp. NPDC017936 TaxID=3365016 RepID=UPI00379903B8